MGFWALLIKEKKGHHASKLVICGGRVAIFEGVCKNIFMSSKKKLFLEVTKILGTSKTLGCDKKFGEQQNFGRWQNF